MRKLLLALGLLAGAAGFGGPAGAAGFVGIAEAAPSARLAAEPTAHVQLVQYGGPDWRARQHWQHRRHAEWRRREAWRARHAYRRHGYVGRPHFYAGPGS